MATNQFALESLLPPTTVKTSSDDPQTNQIIESIQAMIGKKQTIRILDFGAGKGRLLSTISEVCRTDGISVKSWLDYYAFDLCPHDKEECVSVISESYESANDRYFNDETRLLENIALGTFDLIIMCNVFHEIDPRHWLDLFNVNGAIAQALKADGIALIVEDQLIPTGEKAYQNGFLVLDVLQFRKLFKIDETYVVDDARGDGRLKAHFIPKGYLSNIDPQSRVDALDSLLHTAKTRVRELRSSESTYKNGKLHGFWVQQLANSQLALSELTK
mgnify:CR=1 FL=1